MRSPEAPPPRPIPRLPPGTPTCCRSVQVSSRSCFLQILGKRVNVLDEAGQHLVQLLKVTGGPALQTALQELAPRLKGRGQCLLTGATQLHSVRPAIDGIRSAFDHAR